jgi:hypothetical protein
LGPDRIYLQVKRYAADNSVGRHDLEVCQVVPLRGNDLDDAKALLPDRELVVDADAQLLVLPGRRVEDRCATIVPAFSRHTFMEPTFRDPKL